MSKLAAPGSLVLDAAIALEAAAKKLGRAIETRERLVAEFDAVRLNPTIPAQLRTLEIAISRADQRTLAAVNAANAALDRLISPRDTSSQIKDLQNDEEEIAVARSPRQV